MTSARVGCVVSLPLRRTTPVSTSVNSSHPSHKPSGPRRVHAFGTYGVPSEPAIAASNSTRTSAIPSSPVTKSRRFDRATCLPCHGNSVANWTGPPWKNILVERLIRVYWHPPCAVVERTVTPLPLSCDRARFPRSRAPLVIGLLAADAKRPDARLRAGSAHGVPPRRAPPIHPLDRRPRARRAARLSHHWGPSRDG